MNAQAKRSSKMKNKKKSFPDLNKDGKITKADVLKGRGVFVDGGPVEVKADNAVDQVGNPKGKKINAQLTGWGKARH
jgi:hypothetical protein